MNATISNTHDRPHRRNPIRPRFFGFVVAIGTTMLSTVLAVPAHAQQDPDLAAARQAIGNADANGQRDGGALPVGETNGVKATHDAAIAAPEGPATPAPGDLQNLPQPDLDATARDQITRQAVQRIDALSDSALGTFDPAESGQPVEPIRRGGR